MIALLGMLIVPTTIFRSLAGGAILVAIVAMLASLTLLPAILGLIGDRVNMGRIRRRQHASAGKPGGFWDRVTQSVMKRPVTSLLIGAGLLLAAAIPTLSLETGFAGVSTLPSSSGSRQAFDVLAREFAGGLSSPVEIVIDGDVTAPTVQEGIDQLKASLASDGSFRAVRGRDEQRRRPGTGVGSGERRPGQQSGRRVDQSGARSLRTRGLSAGYR